MSISPGCGLQKLSKESAAAFVDLLRQAHPFITSHTTFAAIEAQCQADDRWQALSDDKRYLLCLQQCAYTHIALNVFKLLACC